MYTNFSPFHPNDFSKTVLGWDFETLSKPLAIAMQRAPLPRTEQNVEKYYANFLPLILEEARAIIANGLEQVDKYNELASKNGNKNKNLYHLSDAKGFNLVLKKNANLPKNEGNPMSMIFSGTIPDKIEHGTSMNVLLLTTKGINPEKSFIALATQHPGSSELFAKIIITSSDYDDYEACFNERRQWQANYLGSVISEQRMYDACLEATDSSCVKQIARAHIQIPLTTHISTGSVNIDHLNMSQRAAIYAFMNAKEGSTLLLQGPPGTGKTTTLVALLKQVAYQNKRTMVSAHSNKGVQVLALRAVDEMTDVPMILVGVESKLSEKLKPIFLNSWHNMILLSFSSPCEAIELLLDTYSQINSSSIKLILEIERNVSFAQQALKKFSLIYSHQLSNADKQTLLALSNDPILVGDFQYFQTYINQLKLQPQSEKLWDGLLTILYILENKWNKIKKEALESYLLDHASIIFSTLITAGRKNMLTMAPIDFLLVDEASQSIEAATLIPMRFQPKKILLVGDTKQLPATVISKALDDSDKRFSTHYKWSMMWRLIEENKQPNLMLEIQYRMHPHICQWPSGQYYSDRLITSPEILPMPLLDKTDITSRPYAIYQILGQAESRDGSNSICNIQEAHYVCKIIEHIRQKNISKSIGVITPYVAQKRLISEILSKKKYLQKLVDVNTVDGFQGDERDIIIISFVRTHVSEFLKEFRRLNVAITRAKACLIILGAPSLLSNDIGQLMADARLRKVLYSEADLNNILKMGVVLVEQHANAVTDPLTLAWHGKPAHQLYYAKRVSDKAKAVLWHRRAAENNDPEGQYYMGQSYLRGNEILKKDIQLAIAWLNKSSQQNFSMAQFVLGTLCVSGGVVVKNVSLGITLCERAAKDNLPDAFVFLVKIYDDGIEVPRDVKKLEKYSREAAKLGDLYSMKKLANLLFSGTPENQRESLRWYRILAGRNITEAFYPLAQLLSSVSNNQTEALVWYLKAAECGHREAQYELGLRFKNGSHGCVVDILQSINFFKLSAISGHVQAQFIYASYLKEKGDDFEATRFFKLAGDQGHCESQYQYGLLISKSHRQMAYSYYMKAAYQDHSLAKYECIQYQIQFNCDLADCLRFCEALAAEGNPQAQFLTARILDTGLIGQINKAEAYRYYSLSVHLHPLSPYYCAILLEEGSGVKQDLITARRYYEFCVEKCIGAKLRLACMLLREDPNLREEYERPIELLELYIKHYSKIESVPNTTEYYLENLILNSSVKNVNSNIEVVNTYSAEANYLLGKIFQEGIGVIVDIERALQHYNLARVKLPEANYRIGYIYESGLGVPKNSSTANKYYKSAADNGHKLAAKRLTWAYYLFTRSATIPDDETLRKAESSKCSVM